MKTNFLSVVSPLILILFANSVAYSQVDSWDKLGTETIEKYLNPHLKLITDADNVRGGKLWNHILTQEGAVIRRNPESLPNRFTVILKKNPKSALSDAEIADLVRAFLKDWLTEYEQDGFLKELNEELQNQVTADLGAVFQGEIDSLPPNRVPIVESPRDQTFSVGDKATFQISATDEDGDNLTYSAKGLPASLTMTPTGQISGISTEVGTFSIVITVTDGKLGGSSDAQFQWIVSPLQGDDSFAVPDGLTVSVDSLLQLTGFNPRGHLDGVPFAFTPKTCSGLAAICYRKGLYADARAIADHGLKSKMSSRLLFIRGVCELALGDKDACNVTIEELRKIDRSPLSLAEVSDVNGPIAVRFVLAYESVVAKRSRSMRVSTYRH